MLFSNFQSHTCKRYQHGIVVGSELVYDDMKPLSGEEIKWLSAWEQREPRLLGKQRVLKSLCNLKQKRPSWQRMDSTPH